MTLLSKGAFTEGTHASGVLCREDHVRVEHARGVRTDLFPAIWARQEMTSSLLCDDKLGEVAR